MFYCPVVRSLIFVNIHVFLSGYLGKSLSFIMMIIIINSIPNVELSNCPLLRSFKNDTGSLFVNKTVMKNTESAIHCQWLLAGSEQQVIKFSLLILF